VIGIDIPRDPDWSRIVKAAYVLIAGKGGYDVPSVTVTSSIEIDGGAASAAGRNR
jgi:hypothetical protein